MTRHAPPLSHLALLALLSLSVAAAQQVTTTPVEVHVPTAPTPVPALGRLHLAYELHLTNFDTQPLALREVEAVDSRASTAPLGRWRGADLTARTLLVGSGGQRGGAGVTLPPGRRAVLHLWLTLPPGRPAPPALTHRLLFETISGDLASLASPPVLLGKGPVQTLSAPHGEGRWVAVRGPSNTSGHRWATLALGGVVRNAQRFAVDWVKLGDDGRFFSGNGRRNEDWYGYGEAVLATAGRVVHVRDGFLDRTPLHEDTPDRVTADEATGNAVVLDVGGGRFVVYAHLQKGSITVNAGQVVRQGQAIGRIGNSGNSLAPHLHLHVSDGPDPFAAQGVPFVLARVTLLGQLTSVPDMLRGHAWSPAANRPAREISREMPLENMIVRF